MVTRGSPSQALKLSSLKDVLQNAEEGMFDRRSPHLARPKGVTGAALHRARLQRGGPGRVRDDSAPLDVPTG
jgi:hypothetical protein